MNQAIKRTYQTKMGSKVCNKGVTYTSKKNMRKI